MAVDRVGEVFRCNVCGNEVVVTKVGGGQLVCCGVDMERIEEGHGENSKSEETEEHEE